ncbi:uncharacterized protein LOC130956786 [Arachis stenosperma]|uniref:uncharacterized protein LOC130956786 n=1 Tax=Arachis stenosperma TaxID=217475 RepID=UPI0025AC68CB|nr:uncharacterized protein LOC130956786 [Arachis stenosperma]
MNNSEFTVAETTMTRSFSLGSYRVFLTNQTSDCGYFQALHYPCRHALACYAYARLSWSTYVHEVYRLSSVFDLYRMGFTPPIPERFWPPYDGLRVIPDPTKRRVFEGHPKTTKIQITIDESEPNKAKICGLCRQPGHTRRRCSQGGVTIGSASANNV